MTIEKYHNDKRISACENNWYLCSLHLCGAACGSAVCLPALRTIVGYVAFNFSFSIWHATCFANAGERTTQHKQSTVVIHEKCRSQFQSYLLVNISLRMYLHAYSICVEVIAQSSFRCSVRRDEWKTTTKIIIQSFVARNDCECAAVHVRCVSTATINASVSYHWARCHQYAQHDVIGSCWSHSWRQRGRVEFKHR